MPDAAAEKSSQEPAWATGRVIALRGATTVVANEREAILERTSELLTQMLERNALAIDDLISAIFTVTHDLDAEFPAVAARQIGFQAVPLICTQEIPVPGSLAMVVRVLLHTYVPAGHEAKHVYLHEARTLRADLSSAQ